MLKKHVLTAVKYIIETELNTVKTFLDLSVPIVVTKMKHYLIIGGKLQEDGKHGKSLITIFQRNNINEIVVIITGLFNLICSHFSNDNYVVADSGKVMRIVNKMNDNNISYIEMKEETLNHITKFLEQNVS
jgi:hypothetical protein